MNNRLQNPLIIRRWWCCRANLLILIADKRYRAIAEYINTYDSENIVDNEKSQYYINHIAKKTLIWKMIEM